MPAVEEKKNEVTVADGSDNTDSESDESVPELEEAKGAQAAVSCF